MLSPFSVTVVFCLFFIFIFYLFLFSLFRFSVFSFLIFTIQYGPVHWNLSCLGIAPIFVWETKTGLPTSKNFSLLCQHRLTNALVLLWFCSNWHIAYSRLSSSNNSCSFRIRFYFSWSSHSVTCTRSVGTWNSIIMTFGAESTWSLFCMWCGRPIKHYAASNPSRCVFCWLSSSESFVVFIRWFG